MLTVEFEGKEIVLKEEASFVRDNSQEVKENEMYCFEMKAKGICEGEEVEVYWKFYAKKGFEVYFDDYDYYDVDRVEEV